MSSQVKAPSKEAVRRELWRRGELSWLLDVNQKELYKLYQNSKEQKNVWLLSRRSGKSYGFVVLAIETCLKKPNQIVNFVAPTKLQLKNILRPLFKEILDQGCPEELKPRFSEKDYIYYFSNGSEIKLAGSDSQHAEKLRGGNSHLCLVDEAGDVDSLEYIIDSILFPTTFNTKAKILIAGTPPKISEHDFIKVIERAEASGTLVKRTIYDNPRLTPETIEEIEKEMGGVHSESFRREALCELIIDENTAVVPEFRDELLKKLVVSHPKPAYFHGYVGMDLGYNDLTAVVFAHMDFKANKLIFVDEIIIDFSKSDQNLKILADLINKKEQALWNNEISQEVQRPLTRVSDTNPIALNEIAHHSQGLITFSSANKIDLQANVHHFRSLISENRILIDPKCKTLIRHIKNAKWKNGYKRELARSPDDSHYDALMAAIYLAKSVDFSKNPYPKEPQVFDSFQYNSPKNNKYYNQGFSQPKPDTVAVLKRLLNTKR